VGISVWGGGGLFIRVGVDMCYFVVSATLSVFPLTYEDVAGYVF
jgi:hypothetical protein